MSRNITVLEANAGDTTMQWQPIETAPRDGENVLLADESGSMIVGFWNNRTNAWDDGDYRSFMTWPTHWMPMPKPPRLTGS